MPQNLAKENSKFCYHNKFLCMSVSYAQRHEDWWKIGDIAPRILDLDTIFFELSALLLRPYAAPFPIRMETGWVPGTV
jgi:hypothetical protein